MELIFTKDYAAELEENIRQLSGAITSVSKLGTVNILYFQVGDHKENYSHQIGYNYINIDIVTSFSKCIEKSKSNTYDIYLIDLFGDNYQNALKFIDYLYKNKNHIPVVVFTDHSNPKHIKECLNKGVSNFFEKKDIRYIIDHNMFLKQLLLNSQKFPQTA